MRGSATPQKIKPIPMPALNIIAIQLTVLNSGFSPSLPSGIFPYRLSASHSAKITNPVAEKMNSQPTLRFDVVSIVRRRGWAPELVHLRGAF